MSLGIDSILARSDIWDNFIMLEGGWRVLQGHIPYKDFHSPIGPFIYYLSSLGILIKGNTILAITLANALVLPFVTFIAWKVSQARLTFSKSFLFCLLIIGLTIATRPLGWDYFSGSYSSVYNRYGYIFLLIAFLLLFVPKKTDSSFSLTDGLTIVCLLFLTFLNKITFFLVFLGAILLSYYYFNRSLEWLLKLFGGFLFCLLIFFVASGVSPTLMLQDIYWGQVAFSYNMSSFLRNGIKLVYSDMFSYGLVLVCGILIYLEERNYLILMLYFICSSIFLTLASGTTTEIPLHAATLFVLSSFVKPLPNLKTFLIIRRSDRLAFLEKHKTALVTSIAIFLFVFYTASQDFVSLYRQFNNYEKTLNAGAQSFNGIVLLDYPGEMRWDADSYSQDKVARRISESEKYPPGEYRQILQSGINLLKNNMTETDRVFAWDYTNPFPFILVKASPKNNLIWWHLGKSFSPDFPLESSVIFEDVTLVMVPKRNLDPTTANVMFEKYGDYLKEHFALVEESNLWKLYRKI
jgi:hypothetical protein